MGRSKGDVVCAVLGPVSDHQQTALSNMTSASNTTRMQRMGSYLQKKIMLIWARAEMSGMKYCKQITGIIPWESFIHSTNTTEYVL